jgi:hypothetical protein
VCPFGLLPDMVAMLCEEFVGAARVDTESVQSPQMHVVLLIGMDRLKSVWDWLMRGWCSRHK